jgi:hypothetical protein
MFIGQECLILSYYSFKFQGRQLQEAKERRSLHFLLANKKIVDLPFGDI